MFSLVDSKTVALSLVFAFMAIPALAKPSNWSYTFKSLDSPYLQFDFTGCSTSKSDVVCTGNFRSLREETNFSMDTSRIRITDSKGKTYQADQVNINNHWSCPSKDPDPFRLSNTSCPNLNFIEGVTYKTSFVFRDISLPSKKLALFTLYSMFLNDYDVRIRNIEVVDSDRVLQGSQSAPVEEKPVISPKQKRSSSHRLGDSKSIKFDFYGCSKANGSDVVCMADFLSLSGDQWIEVGPSRVIIVDAEGQSYVPSEVSVNDHWSCSVNVSCHDQITLVEGVSYKTTFTFRDVSLPSRKLALFSLTSRGKLNIRNIQVSE